MPPPTDPKRLGPPVDLTSEQIDQVAEVAPIDVAAARALWHAQAPPKLADLLEAAKPDVV